MATQAPQQPGTGLARTPLGENKGAFRIEGLSDPLKKKWLNCLFYAAPGAGKTTLAGSIVDVPPARDVLFIAAESGELTLEDNPRIEHPDDIDVVRIQRIEQLQKIFEFLYAHCMFRDQGNLAKLEELQRVTFGIPAGEDVGRIREYHSVVLDSISEIEAQNLTKILDLASQGVDAGADMATADWPAYRANNNQIQRITRQFRDLPVHFICIAAQAYSQDERKRYHYTPALAGKLKDQIQGFFDVVGWLVPSEAQTPEQIESGATPRRLFVQPQASPRADAKCRISSYRRAYFDDPVMRDILKATGFSIE